MSKVLIESRESIVESIKRTHPWILKIAQNSGSHEEFKKKIVEKSLNYLKENTAALDYFYTSGGINGFYELEYHHYAVIRILDYAENEGKFFEDQNTSDNTQQSRPFEILFNGLKKNTIEASSDFFLDWKELLDQLEKNTNFYAVSPDCLESWINRHPDGFDEKIILRRAENKLRIVEVIVDLIDSGKKIDSKYFFKKGVQRREKISLALEWWSDYRFHLRFAARDPETLNLFLGNSLSPETLTILNDARDAGIPFFINPYYASLLDVEPHMVKKRDDLVIREYILYSRSLVDAFGSISAWEKEDIIEFGKPNAAGWMLPSGGNVHRRYPDSAILIPNTRGRACGGLCTTCQRMYNLQKNQEELDIDKLAPRKTWSEKLVELMGYFKDDTQLKDILITGGDALMSTDKSLKNIFDEIIKMAREKSILNMDKKEGDKIAPIKRIRLGTRLPAYLPQRITGHLGSILKDFKKRGLAVGIEQFVVQTHFESAMEITPLVYDAIKILQNSGWTVVNQTVFTGSSSRRGHTVKLRQILGKLGVYPYYTFAVKGFKENSELFATNARLVQEMLEEKSFGLSFRNG
ncbi:MAG: KamA family protein, partial [Deltaproteobacteria bacterium]|nr:KamA family protein [Deltaproteobacteria bacterium]